jgi:acetyl/propionyl-CoA carboxylase alpha subunit
VKDSLLSVKISGIPSTIPIHISALNDLRFIEGSYYTSFIDDVKPFFSKEGKIAAATLATPMRSQTKIKDKKEEDPWIRSRYDSISSFNVFPTLNRWMSGQ